MDDSQLLGLMQVFISVADCGSFSEAARRLASSQPSISRQINLLEQKLGVRLIQRSTRRLSLTEAGQMYYEQAKKIQREVLETNQAIRGFSEHPSGLLRISAPHTWTELNIVPYLQEFLELYPEIQLSIECNDNIQDIIEDRLDLVIRVGVARDSSYVAVPFGDVSMLICGSPDYLKRHGYPETAQDLQQHNFILYEHYSELLLHRDGDSFAVKLKGSVQSNAVSVLLSSVRQGVGLTVLGDLMIAPWLQSGELVQLLPQYKVEVEQLPVESALALYSNRKHLPAKVRAFLDFFKPRFAGRPL